AFGAMAALRRYGPTGAGRQKELQVAAQPAFDPVREGFYLDLLYQKGIGGLVVGIGTVVAALFEPYGIDGIVNGVGVLAQRAGDGIKRLHSGFVRRYALTLFAGLALFMIYYILV